MIQVPTSISFGERVKRQRKLQDLTQAELAKRGGCARVTIHKIECNSLRPSKPLAERLAQALQISPAERAAFVELARGMRATCELRSGVRASARPLNNLPLQLTSFIGREREMDEVRQQLASARLLTLTGSGGTGKTRLSLQVAAQLCDSFVDGVWFVELASLSDAVVIPGTIASVLGVHEESGRSMLATLLEWLRPKELLLILDNCEHLIEACANLVDALLHAGAGTRVLATSREALGIAGELVWRVPSLPTPHPNVEVSLQQLKQNAAVRLFIERATQSLTTFRVTATNAPVVAQICFQLDGIPLAIELAAARVKSMRVELLAERLDSRFQLLTGGRTAIPRHQTLRALIDWSHSLLSESERVLLRRLSVFAGGWTLEAAEAVCGEDIGKPSFADNQFATVIHPQSYFLPRTEVLDLLSHLVEKSLVVGDEQATEPRYRMLETLRQYARERLQESGELDRLHAEHLDYFQKLVQKAEAPLRTAQREEWVPRLSAEHGNLTTALEWACEHDLEAARLMAAGLSLFWHYSVHINEARTWYTRVLKSDNATAKTKATARALLGAAWTSAFILELSDARSLYQDCISLSRELDDSVTLAEALFGLGWVAVHLGQSENACVIYEANESIIRSYDNPYYLAGTLHWWGLAVATARGDYAKARTLLEEALAVGRKLNDPSSISTAYGHLGKLATLQGDLSAARQFMFESVALSRQSSGHAEVGVTLGMLADVVYLQGDYVEAGALYEEALAMFSAVGDDAHFAHIATGIGYLAVQQGDLKEASRRFAESLDILSNGQFQLGMARCLAGYAALKCAQGRADQSVRLLATELVYAHSRTSHIPIDRIRYDRTLAAARSQLDEGIFHDTWGQGRRLTVEQAIAEAQQVVLAPATAAVTGPSPRDPHALTVREVEVLRLVAAGLRDAQVAERLVISRRTVSTHLTSIYGKLGVNSRSAATRYTLEHHLT